MVISMQGNILSIGDKIELYHCSKRLNSIYKPKKYISQLLDLSENKASISMPLYRGKLIPLEIGETYALSFFTKLGLYQCLAVVTNRYRNQNLIIAEVEFTSDLEKNQRRQYFRLECLIDFQYREVTTEEVALRQRYNMDTNGKEDEIQKVKEDEKLIVKEDEKQKVKEDEKQKVEEMLDEIPITWINGVITDISGGGLRFTSEREQQNDEQLMLSFSLVTKQGLKVFQQLANIISTKALPNRKSLYEYRVEFQDISKEDREAIVRYVFEEERKQRHKEKGMN